MLVIHPYQCMVCGLGPERRGLFTGPTFTPEASLASPVYLSPKTHVFGLWEEVEVPKENPRTHGENMQSPQGRNLWPMGAWNICRKRAEKGIILFIKTSYSNKNTVYVCSFQYYFTKRSFAFYEMLLIYISPCKSDILIKTIYLRQDSLEEILGGRYV